MGPGVQRMTRDGYWRVLRAATLAVLVSGCEHPPDWDRIAPPELLNSSETAASLPQANGAQTWTEGEIILNNGSFEDSSMEPWRDVPTRGQSLDTTIKVDGLQSLRIDRPGQTGYIEIRQDLQPYKDGLRPLGRYRLTGQLKAEGLQAPAYLKVLTGKHMRSMYVGDLARYAVSGTQDWKK